MGYPVRRLELQVDDLFTKIGILTVENDMLRAELNQAKERINELERRLEDAHQPETVAFAPPKE
jgi:regulator of replication initiation timing